MAESDFDEGNGVKDSREDYRSSYLNNATGKSDAFASMNRRPQGAGTAGRSASASAKDALKRSESAATNGRGGLLGSSIGSSKDSLTGGIKNSVAGKAAPAAKAGKGKFKAAKPVMIAIFPLVVILLVGVTLFTSDSMQPFALDANVNEKANKLSAVTDTSVTNEIGYRLNSTDPADGFNDYMISLFEQNGFDYHEIDNGDGTVARALVYTGSDDTTTLIADSSVKDLFIDTLSSTGAIINNYRSFAATASGQEESSAALYGVTSIISTGVWYDDQMDLTYERLGVAPNKFNSDSPNPSKEEIIESVRSGSATEDVNATTGTTERWVWTRHPYSYCNGWRTVKNPDGSTSRECTGYTSTELWDWDSVSSIGGQYARDPLTSDPFASIKGRAIAAETCEPWGGRCATYEIQSDAADTKAFDLQTSITYDDDQSSVQEKLGNRAILAAFSTNPHGQSEDPKGTVTDTKSNDSVIAALTTMVQNKTLNFAQSYLTAIEKAKAGDGGMEMNYYSNLVNTPAKSYNADGEEVSNMAAAASTSFNSWFSENIKVDSSNQLVEKYNTTKMLNTTSQADLAHLANTNEMAGNYNNIDNISSNSRIAENMNNTYLDEDKPEKGRYYYCEYHPSASAKCPRDKGASTSTPAETLKTEDYSGKISDTVAKYAYALTSIDLNSDPAGEEAAVAMNEGILILHDAALKQSSGTYGDQQTVADTYEMVQDYIGKAANYDRYTKSPFDTSSTHTFLGSIISSLMPFATTVANSTIFSTVSSAFQIVGSSVSSLLPSASAVDELKYLIEETNTDCVAGDMADMTCNNYGISTAAMSKDLMNESMASIQSRMESEGYIECTETDDGKTKCDPVGEETTDDTTGETEDPKNKYVAWLKCTNNDTLINTSRSTSDNNGSKHMGFFDILKAFFEDLFGIPKGSENQVICGGDYTANQDLDADTIKLFAQFNINQRVQVQMEELEYAIAPTYLRAYYQEHPLDNSFEGIIARQAGLTVAELQQAFAEMEYAVYIAEYDPSSRYQFVDFLPDTTISVENHLGDSLSIAAIVGKLQDYEEIRSRTHTV